MRSESGGPNRQTAAAHMVERVPVAGPRDSVEEARARLIGRDYDAVDPVYVTDGRGRLRGLVSLATLLGARGDEPIERIMRRDPPAVAPDLDQEAIAGIALLNRLTAVPVVDEGRRLLGSVAALSLIEILRSEHVEDVHRLAGMRHRSEQALTALRDRPVRRLEHRLPWLLVGMVGSGVAAWVTAGFADVLEARVAVAFFVPGIVYLADAIGTQTGAIAIRGLSLGEARLPTLLGGEVATGLLMGVVLGALAFAAVWLAFGDVPLAAAVALALVAAGSVATAIGILLPWVLSRFGRDPAFGAGPVATVIQDVLSLVIYFTLVRVLLA